MCGEHNAIAANSLNQSGSSPHVRGALQAGLGHHVGRGIIPACAGSTLDAKIPQHLVGDHPRMCGEHDGVQAILTTDKGSSPHVRGAPRSSARIIRMAGIIPACAGSTMDVPAVSVTIRDHPRMCGEHDCTPDTMPFHRGSSPHVRGAPDTTPVDAGEGGIIPACAGSTSSTDLRSSSKWDHPRMCGEHGLTAAGLAAAAGSSPHVRGAR